MDGKPDLRPCPFCGGYARLVRCYNGWVQEHPAYMVVCDKCTAQGLKTKELEIAVKAWNRRVEPENRVLTLEEATEIGEPVWLEAMGTVRIAQIYLSPGENLAECKTIGHAYPEYLYTGDYGKLWRCWLRKPTAEEMANAIWEE